MNLKIVCHIMAVVVSSMGLSCITYIEVQHERYMVDIGVEILYHEDP